MQAIQPSPSPYPMVEGWLANSQLFQEAMQPPSSLASSAQGGRLASQCLNADLSFPFKVYVTTIESI